MIHVIPSPYYLGHRDVGMGAGPTALLDAGVVSRLQQRGLAVASRGVEVRDPPDHEIGATFAALRALARVVSGCASGFPLVFGGNCNVALAVIAGRAPRPLRVVWFDAHGDFHSPDTTASGFFDGFPLHMLVGRSWRTLTSTVPGFHPIAESDVLLAGTRDLDAGEEALLEASDVRTYDADRFAAAGVDGFDSALEEWAAPDDEVYVHVDLDVLDRDLVPANPYSAPGGLPPDDLERALRAVGHRTRVVAASLNCYSPDGDPEGRARDVAIDVVGWLASLAPEAAPA